MNTLYCHFNFKRPKGKDYGLFAVAFYYDEEGKELATHITRKEKLWVNHQFITAIQAYEHALYTIYSLQGQMKKSGYTNVLLVTDNSTLAGWIEDHKKNRHYTEYMNRAVEQYRSGAPKEITLGIGLCQVREYEKAYKYCREELVVHDREKTGVQGSNGRNVINLTSSNIAYKTITEIEQNNPNKPTIVGMNEA